MTQEEKELLLKDLCARLPYGVKVYNTTFKEPTIQTLYGKISDNEFLMEETYTSVGVDGDDFGSFNKRHYTGYIDFIRPYLRPMSSMTDEEVEDYFSICTGSIRGDMVAKIDFYIKHHFDFRLTSEGLSMIEAGLALEAPKGMYEY